MKISHMLKREDFYKINELTLNRFFEPTDKSTTLYVYPHLNAIVRCIPSGAVKKYIYAEYSVNASWYKRCFVWMYTRLCLNTFGLLASKRIKLNADVTRDMLIYPCNRKIRVFDFERDVVSVITKAGFSLKSLNNEIAFRTECEPCEFILPVDSYTEDVYSERIIDGMPLARLKSDHSEVKKNALMMWQEYSAPSRKNIEASQYAQILSEKINFLIERIKNEKSLIDTELLCQTLDGYLDVLRSSSEIIPTIQSHGDFHSGNIWVENKTGQIYIIDWESVGERSIWYDEAVLYDGIRKPQCFDDFIKKDGIKYTTVLIEDMIFRMNEFCELPFDNNPEAFNNFIKKLGKC